MSADAFSTAAYALGPARGIDFLARQNVEGLLISEALQTWETHDFGRYRA
jgi:thiamine biosynthesis lipoprotein ApbE